MKRNQKIDEIKGLAVLFVIIGHCIQCCSGASFYESESYFYYPLFELIYTFHMPLFAMISGFLFFYTVQKRNLKEVLLNRWNTLVIPIISWGTINYASKIFIKIEPIYLESAIKEYCWTILSTLWFLWAILFCSCVISVCYYICPSQKPKNSLIVLSVFMLFSLLITDRFNLGYAKFLFPFFAVGFYLNQYKVWEIVKVKLFINSKYCTLGLLAVYLFLFVLFNRETFIYTSGVCVIGKERIVGQLFNDVLRWVIGFAGILLFVRIFSAIDFHSAKLAKIGQESLGMYIVNGYMSHFFFEISKEWATPSLWPIFLIPMLLICYGGVVLLKISPLRKILLGGRS